MELTDFLSVIEDDNGRLHILIDKDVVVHFHGNKQEIVHGVSVDYSATKIVATAGNHHTNPAYSTELEQQVNNRFITDQIKQKTDKFYAKPGRANLKAMGRSLMFNERLRRCGCKND